VRLVPQVNRGVKWAFPRCGALPDGSWVTEHDPESAFPVGHRFFWYEFKSSAQDFAVMYLACFCGEAGPRTIFTILACEGYRIQVFSHLPNEAEVLFRPLSQFEVVAAQKRLAPQHLLQNAAKGGFPDEITLKQLPREGGGASQALGQPLAAAAPCPTTASAVRAFTLLVDSSDTALVPGKKRCQCQAANVEQLRLAIQSQLNLSCTITVLVFDGDFEEWVEFDSLDDLPEKAKVRVDRQPGHLQPQSQATTAAAQQELVGSCAVFLSASLLYGSLTACRFCVSAAVSAGHGLPPPPSQQASQAVSTIAQLAAAIGECAP
jgi:hypothetical protein